MKRTGFDASEVALSWLCGEITVGVRSDVSLPLHMHTSVFLSLVNGFVDDALSNTVPGVNEPLL